MGVYLQENSAKNGAKFVHLLACATANGCPHRDGQTKGEQRWQHADGRTTQGARLGLLVGATRIVVDC